MKLFGVIALFAIALCVASTEIESLSHLTKDIDRVLPEISIDVTSALSGEINDLINGNSPLIGDLKDIIIELQSIQQNLPDRLKLTARKVFLELTQLNDSLNSGDFTTVHPLIAVILETNNVLKSNI